MSRINVNGEEYISLDSIKSKLLQYEKYRDDLVKQSKTYSLVIKNSHDILESSAKIEELESIIEDDYE